jgi:hypothetical protein
MSKYLTKLVICNLFINMQFRADSPGNKQSKPKQSINSFLNVV